MLVRIPSSLPSRPLLTTYIRRYLIKQNSDPRKLEMCVSVLLPNDFSVHPIIKS
jgi:hypothetical protein